MPGVGLVDFHGQQRPAVRIRLDPDKLTARGLTLEDVRAIVGVQTVNAPKGSLNGPDRSVVFNATDQITTSADYRELVVAYKNGAPVRVRDLGEVVDAAEDTQQAAWLQARPRDHPRYSQAARLQRRRRRSPASRHGCPRSKRPCRRCEPARGRRPHANDRRAPCTTSSSH